MLIIGGHNGEDFLNTLYALDFEKECIETFDPLLQERSFMVNQAFKYKDFVYIIGGICPSGYVRMVEKWCISRNKTEPLEADVSLLRRFNIFDRPMLLNVI